MIFMAESIGLLLAEITENSREQFLKGPQQLQKIFYRILCRQRDGISSITLTGEPVNASD
jgi:hypothetical protein